MRQSDVIAVAVNAIRVREKVLGRKLTPEESTKLNFESFAILGAIDWFRVDPDDGQFDLVDGAEPCTDPPSGPAYRIKRGAEV